MTCTCTCKTIKYKVLIENPGTSGLWTHIKKGDIVYDKGTGCKTQIYQ